MEPVFVEGNIRADCPDCGVPCTFEFRAPSGSGEFGTVMINKPHRFKDDHYDKIFHKLFRCTVCHRPGVATIHVQNDYQKGALESFWPLSVPFAKIPNNIPEQIEKELREAESCMSVGAWRGAAALLRSTLEKLLIKNGYENERNLYNKIEAAGADGIITSARRQKAQDLIRTLGNDVLHEEWREVSREEVEDAHHYVARIREDLYDDRNTVESVLTGKGRVLQ
jgi:hypothetical protein